MSKKCCFGSQSSVRRGCAHLEGQNPDQGQITTETLVFRLGTPAKWIRSSMILRLDTPHSIYSISQSADFQLYSWNEYIFTFWASYSIMSTCWAILWCFGMFQHICLLISCNQLIFSCFKVVPYIKYGVSSLGFYLDLIHLAGVPHLKTKVDFFKIRFWPSGLPLNFGTLNNKFCSSHIWRKVPWKFQSFTSWSTFLATVS